jgi:hypothetical protein
MWPNQLNSQIRAKIIKCNKLKYHATHTSGFNR